MAKKFDLLVRIRDIEQKVVEEIVYGLLQFQRETTARVFVIGVSGGVDSALVSTLACMAAEKANITVIAVSLPTAINMKSESRTRAIKHMAWLEDCYNTNSVVRIAWVEEQTFEYWYQTSKIFLEPIFSHLSTKFDNNEQIRNLCYRRAATTN